MTEKKLAPLSGEKKTKTTKKAPAKKEEESSVYFEAVGRRKTASARVRIFNSKEAQKPEIIVNKKDISKFFATKELVATALSALVKMKAHERFSATVIVKGGGINAQAVAIRHGIARALVKFNMEFRKRLKKAEFLKRDPRMKERRKFGLKKARKAPQWSKR